jgi:hypothetical protein
MESLIEKDPWLKMCCAAPDNTKQIRKKLAINSSLITYVSSYNKESSHILESIKHIDANPSGI